MRKILTSIAGVFVGLAIVASAQVAPANIFKYVGTSIVPVNASSTIGTSTKAVAGGYFTNLTVNGTCTGCAGVTSNSTTTIAGVVSKSFIIATSSIGSVFDFATSSNTITFKFPVSPSFSGTLGVTGKTTLTTASTTVLTATDLFASGNLSIAGTSNHTGKTTMTTASTTVLTATDLFASGNFSVAGTAGVTGKTTLGLASSTALSVSGLTVLASSTINGSLTMNGSIIPRTTALTASTSITVNTDTTDIGTVIVKDATSTFQVPTGTNFNGKMFELMLTATTTRGLGWVGGAGGFASSTDLAMPITTASGTCKYVYEYRTQSNFWELSGLICGFIN